MSWIYSELFSYRGAFMQIGTVLGTIMVANVLMVIIPGQKKVVASLIKNETPDAKYGIVAKQRSLHNNYLTLPVIFIMISNHYPIIYATKYSWLIIPIILIIGALIRHFFNVKHTGIKPPYWIIFPIIILLSLSMFISNLGKPKLTKTNQNAHIIKTIPEPILTNAQVVLNEDFEGSPLTLPTTWGNENLEPLGDAARRFEKQILLQVLDQLWKEHLATMDQLRQGIGLRAYAQKNPKQEYKRESFALFEDLLNNIKYETIRYLSHIEVATEDDMRRLEQQRRDEQKNREYQHAKAQGMASQDGREDESGVAIEGRKPVQRLGPKVGRNDPCTCGSGTKYKQCCGRIQ